MLRTGASWTSRPLDPAATIDHALPIAFGAQIGPYKLREQIGEGGMGVVYVAEQTAPVKRKVALKIIKPGMASREVVSRFEAERQALAMMDHPNIAKVHDGGATDSGQPYFVMELVQGLSITEYCDQHRLPTTERLKLFIAVCRAIQHAHQKGIIHRDLKPSNVLVPKIDGEPAPKVIDFGVAKAVGQKLIEQTIYTQFAQLVGSPLYMSPEQADLGVVDVDTRSDVYSLGVLLYELLTGSTPFDSDTLRNANFDEMRRIIREDDPQRPSARVSTLNAEAQSTVAQRRGSDARQLGQSLKGELDWIVMTALEKDRNRRYESASALAEDVERHLRDEPIEARPASRWYRAQKFVRRNRALVTSSAAVILALLTGLTLATVGFVQANRRLEQVTDEQEDNRELISLLSDMYPKPFLLVHPGLNRTVYESIEELAEEVNNGRLSGHPRVEIEVRTIFADSYFSALEFDKFREHLYKALELAEREYGDHSRVVARIHERLAYEINHNAEGFVDRERVLQHANKAIVIYNRVGTESNRAWISKAIALKAWPERHDEAIAAAKEAVLRDGEHPVWTYVDLGNLHMEVDDDAHLDQALECFTQALKNHGRRDDPEAHMRGSLLAFKARCHWLRGELDLAINGYQEAYDLYRSSDQLRGESEGHSIGSKLVHLHFAIGDVDATFDLLDEIESSAQEFNVASSRIGCLGLRGWLYFQLGDYIAAEPLLKKAKQLARAKYGVLNGRYGISCLYLALTYDALKQPEDAVAQYLDLQPLTQRYVDASYVAGVPYWAHARGILAASDGEEEEVREAKKITEAGLAEKQAWRQTSHEPAFYALKAGIERRLSPEKVDAAIGIFQEGLAKAKEPTATIRNVFGYQMPTDRWQVEAKLVELLVKAEQTDEAHQVMKDAVVVRSDAPMLGPEHIQTILAEIRLGEFRQQQGLHNSDTAEELEAAYEKLRPFSSVVDGVRRRLAQLVVEVYESLGTDDEAAKWQIELQRLNDSGDEQEQATLRHGNGAPPALSVPHATAA